MTSTANVNGEAGESKRLAKYLNPKNCSSYAWFYAYGISVARGCPARELPDPRCHPCFAGLIETGPELEHFKLRAWGRCSGAFQLFLAVHVCALG